MISTKSRSVGRLDFASHLPLHAQAEQQLRELIASPGFGPGALLPDEVGLAAKMGVSRNTLRAAIARLVQEGRLQRRAGVGTRIVEPRVQSGVGAWHSFTREMEAKGIRVETIGTTAVWTKATDEVARALQIDSGARILRLERIRGWNGRPQVHFVSFFHPRLKLVPSDDFQQPLYELIGAKSRVIAHSSDEELRAVAANPRIARALDIEPGSPLLRRVRVVRDTPNRPMEFAVVHYRCEDFGLTLRLQEK